MPEEINRILTDRISTILFCPTSLAVKNLTDEGFEKFNCTIVKSGDVMLDAALFYSSFSDSEKLNNEILNDFSNGYILCTIHRAENTNDPARLTNIIEALNEINETTPIILPLHPIQPIILN